MKYFPVTYLSLHYIYNAVICHTPIPSNLRNAPVAVFILGS